MRSFWFGKELPGEFTEPVINKHLSFDGQIHFRCCSCTEVTWVDVTLARPILENRANFTCPNCHGAPWWKRFGRKRTLEVVQFSALESRLCRRCGSQRVDPQQQQFECGTCHASQFAVDETLIYPSYPGKLFIYNGPNKPIGQSPDDDAEFFSEYVRGLRMAPQFHENCIYLITFIESIFKHIYGSSAEATNLLNVASAIMRTVYKESGNRDAGYLSIAMMMEGRDLALNPIQRAVFGLNISQNVYSVLARRDADLLSLRFGFDLKQYGSWLSRQTLADLERINEDWLAQLRAQQKWLLGDILKSLDPSEIEIDEALQWFDAALADPGLPMQLTDYVRESILTARAKRNDLTEEDRSRIKTGLSQLNEQKLDETVGMQRIEALRQLLSGTTRHKQREKRHSLALRCLGEAISYTASNGPRNMLRHAGTTLSRLAAGFAAERFDAGVPLDGIAGVEALRSLAIEQGSALRALGRGLHDVELKLLSQRLLGTGSDDPAVLAERMVAEHRISVENNLRNILAAEADRAILWFEVWDGTMLTATIQLRSDVLEVREARVDLDSAAAESLGLPAATTSPSRLRARQVETTLASGWRFFKPALDGIDSSTSIVLVGPSSLGSWPVDAAEVLQNTKVDRLRSLAFSPTISVASASCDASRRRTVASVLLLPYGGVDLPGIRTEIEGIQAAYGDRVTLLDGQIVKKQLVLESLSGEYDVIHCCGHGDFDYFEPMQSKIYFHADKGSDGVVSAADILRCGSVGRRPVVVLSACSSATVLPSGSNNFLGLAGSLIRTGAIAIVGARWPISDDVCANFSMHFHDRLAAGYSATEATALAKGSLRNSRVDEWSAFMCIGG